MLDWDPFFLSDFLVVCFGFCGFCCDSVFGFFGGILCDDCGGGTFLGGIAFDCFVVCGFFFESSDVCVLFLGGGIILLGTFLTGGVTFLDGFLGGIAFDVLVVLCTFDDGGVGRDGSYLCDTTLGGFRG